MRRIACAALALVLCAALPQGGGASAQEGESLQEQIRDARAAVAVLSARLDQLRALEGQLEERETQLQGDRVQLALDLMEVQDELHTAELELGTAETAWHTRVREAYMEGPGADSLGLLAADSVSELNVLTEYIKSALESDLALVEDLDARRGEVEELADRALSRERQLQVREAELVELREITAEDTTDVDARLGAARLALEQVEEAWAAYQLLQMEALLADSPDVPESAVVATTDQAGFMSSHPFGPTQGIPPGFMGTGVTTSGVASWYGPGFHGKPTASGAVFDQNGWTAASLGLPLGTILLVTHNGLSVIVYVNDRGPFGDNRQLDLSYAAAASIGITGVGWFEAEVLEIDPAAPGATPPPATTETTAATETSAPAPAATETTVTATPESSTAPPPAETTTTSTPVPPSG